MESFSTLARCDIFVELKRYSSFCKTADTHLHGHDLCLEEKLCDGADTSYRGISWESTCSAR